MRQYTREVSTDLGAKITIRIEADNNQAVVLKDDDLGYSTTLDPKAVNQLGQHLIQAARIAAINVLDPPAQRTVRDGAGMLDVRLGTDQ